MNDGTTITEEHWNTMTSKCDNCEHVLGRHLDTQQEPSPCVVTYCRCPQFVEHVESDVITVTISREDADSLFEQMREHTEFGTVSACEAFEAALKETK
jgi:hypothetical protein